MDTTTATAVLACWLAATLLHFLLTALLVGRWLDDGNASVDARLFAIVLGGVGSLSIILHVTALTVGLGLGQGLSAMALWHAGALIVTRQLRPEKTSHSATPLSVPELVAVATLATVLFSWLDVAAQSAVVSGTDAAHYHVPFAVNLALGGSVLDPPATQHVYPVAGSVMSAWFILPLQVPLLVDLSMCLPFLVLLTSLNLLFRLTTGLSGLAWNTWFVLLLFATPLFRQSSLVSADLWFAAGFVAVVTSIIAAWQQPRWPTDQALLAALALGLVLGSKTTGALAALLLLASAALTRVARRATRAPETRRKFRWSLLAAASALAIVSGGLWLIRNWLMFGSPVAPTGMTVMGHSIFSGEPLRPSLYLSVLGDMEKDSGYDLADRTMRYSRQWLGRWWLVGLTLIALVPVDLLLKWRTRREDARYSSRALVLVMTFLVGSILVKTLIGAPWTSLEWTRGFSLRYALPIVALLPFLAFVGLFPLNWPWYRHRDFGIVGLVLLIAACGLAFVASPTVPRAAPMPPLVWGWLAAGAFIAILTHWLTKHSIRVRVVAATLSVAGVAIGMAPVVAARYDNELQRLEQVERDELAALEKRRLPLSPARQLYLEALVSEQTRGLQCDERRFFTLTRFDEPLALQSPSYRNRVYYVGREVLVGVRPPPLSNCDYLITTPALTQTLRGASIARRLAQDNPTDELARVGDFMLLALRRPRDEAATSNQ